MGLELLLRRALQSIKSSLSAFRRQCLSYISASEIREEFAHHDPNIARINNGSFGCCPASVLAAQSKWQLLYLSQPDDFYFNHLQPSILRSRQIIKELINAANVDEVTIVDNVTTAAAIVFQHLSWAFTEDEFKKGDAVVVLQHGYPAVKKSLHAYISRAGGHVIEIPTPFPVTSDEEIILAFKKALTDIKSRGQHTIRLAVIDHVTSMPSMVIPVKELTKICRDEGVNQVFVDGAHAIGNVEVDVDDIGADYYTSNLHKWLFCPPAAAFLYCRKTPDLHHPIVSHERGKGLAAECSWIGTRDYSTQLLLPSIIDFVNRFEGGLRGMIQKNHNKAVEMGEMLANSWNTGLGSPPDMCSSMAMVGLPECLGISSESDALKLRTHLREEFKIEVHIYYHNEARGGGERADAMDHESKWYVRISHQVYNVVDDYHRLRDAINKLIQDGFTCTMLSSMKGEIQHISVGIIM